MKDKSITRKISQGVYVLTSKNCGCIVDSVSQISSGDNPLISVAVMKENYTNESLKGEKYFALSVLGKNVSKDIIDTFGMHSMRDYDKFSFLEVECMEKDIPIIKGTLGYMLLEIVDYIDTGTHDLFIGRLREADKFSDEEELTYGFYQKHKERYIKVKTDNNKTAWVCTVCGYVYYGEELPQDFKCPKCGVDKSLFEKRLG